MVCSRVARAGTIAITLAQPSTQSFQVDTRLEHQHPAGLDGEKGEEGAGKQAKQARAGPGFPRGWSEKVRPSMLLLSRAGRPHPEPRIPCPSTFPVRAAFRPLDWLGWAKLANRQATGGGTAGGRPGAGLVTFLVDILDDSHTGPVSLPGPLSVWLSVRRLAGWLAGLAGCLACLFWLVAGRCSVFSLLRCSR